MPDAIWEAGEVQFKLTTKLPQKEQKQFEAVAANVPAFRKGAEAISKSAGAAAALFGGIAAFATFMMASSGLRAVLGAFFDLIGMVSDLLFVALLPFIIPMLDAFVEFAKDVAFWAKQPGGILGNLDQIFQSAGETFMTIIALQVPMWVAIGAAIGEGIWNYMTSKGPNLGPFRGMDLENLPDMQVPQRVFTHGTMSDWGALKQDWKRIMPSWVLGG